MSKQVAVVVLVFYNTSVGSRIDFVHINLNVKPRDLLYLSEMLSRE